MSDSIKLVPDKPKAWCHECGQPLANESEYRYLSFRSINGHPGTVVACDHCFVNVHNRYPGSEE